MIKVVGLIGNTFKKGGLKDYPSTVMAWFGQAFTHAMHMIQSSARVGSDFSLTKSNTFIGHMSTHTPSPSHFSLSTVTVGILFTYPN
jgi:hypothetical protein